MALARSSAGFAAVCGPSASLEPRSSPQLQIAAPRSSLRPTPLSQSLAKSQPIGTSAQPWAIRAVEAAAPAEAEAVPIEKSFPNPPAVLDINKIKEMLPHRFPFLLVDRVIEYEPGKSAVGIKNVTVNDNFFPGHFPERPIMPGVLMVEAMAQVGGLVLLTDEVGGNKENFFFAGVDKIRFRKPVVPGDTLVMKMTLIKIQKTFGIAKMSGKAYVGKDLVCDGDFLLAIGS